MRELFFAALANYTLVTVAIVTALSQIIKVIYYRFRDGKWDLWHLFEAGGMPSSHSASVTALTLGVALQFGVNTALFTACLVFALIVIYDATGVRRSAGKQAETLNMVVGDLYKGQRVHIAKHKEILGHDPVEVLAGAAFAVVITLITYYVYFAG